MMCPALRRRIGSGQSVVSLAEFVGGQGAQEFNRNSAVDVTHDLGRR